MANLSAAFDESGYSPKSFEIFSYSAIALELGPKGFSFEDNCLGFSLGQVKPERARNNKSILVCNEESKNWIAQQYNFTIISNLQDKFMISVDEYYEDIEIKGVSILGSFGYIKAG